MDLGRSTGNRSVDLAAAEFIDGQAIVFKIPGHLEKLQQAATVMMYAESREKVLKEPKEFEREFRHNPKASGNECKSHNKFQTRQSRQVKISSIATTDDSRGNHH